MKERPAPIIMWAELAYEDDVIAERQLHALPRCVALPDGIKQLHIHPGSGLYIPIDRVTFNFGANAMNTEGDYDINGQPAWDVDAFRLIHEGTVVNEWGFAKQTIIGYGAKFKWEARPT